MNTGFLVMAETSGSCYINSEGSVVPALLLTYGFQVHVYVWVPILVQHESVISIEIVGM
jgi:hypothetical protein